MKSRLTERLNNYCQLMRLDKPIGSLLLLWPTLWALWIASSGIPPLPLLIIFLLGTLLMRSAGCVLNDLADRKFDGKVSRTKNRPFALGSVSVKEALLLAGILCFCAALLLIALNNLTRVLALLAAFVAASYPFSKRFFPLPQAYLGIAFSFGILMAFAATQNNIPLTAWLLFISNMFWTIAYDTEYAMVDKEDDLKIGIKTSAITFGKFDVSAVIFCYTVFVLLMIWVGVRQQMSLPYWLSIATVVVLIARQYLAIRFRSPQKCFNAFLQNNYLGMIVFFGVVLQYFYNYGFM